MATKQVEIEHLQLGTSSLAKAADDEPVFVLRAQDILAPILVNLWAQLANLSPQGPCPKTLEARSLAALMGDWQRRHNRCKWPD